MAGENKPLLDSQAVISLTVPFVQLIFSYVIAHFTTKKLPRTDKWLVVWLVYNASTHFILEGAFVFLSLTGTVEKPAYNLSILNGLWKEYGKTDRRWLVSDPNIVSLEILTVFLAGPLAVALIYDILRKNWGRHYTQILLCVCELYGGWMTFCPEWLTGSKNLSTGSPLYLWVYLVFFNGLWVVIPLLMLCQSYQAMRPKSARSAAKTPSQAPAQKRYNLRSKND